VEPDAIDIECDHARVPFISSSAYEGIWRGRMGVEPTGAGITNARTVLKTGEATGPLPPPLLAASSGDGEFNIAD
jgi:hypothetical protein